MEAQKMEPFRRGFPDGVAAAESPAQGAPAARMPVENAARLHPAAHNRRFRHIFRIQMAVVLLTVGALTLTYVLLAARESSSLATNLIFASGLGFALAILLATTLVAGAQIGRVFERLQRSDLCAVEALLGALAAKDEYRSDRSAHVNELSVATGRALGLSEGQLEALSHGALFHDIGKIGIPDRILEKPSVLTHAEREIVNRHTVIGQRILAPLDFLAPALPIVRHARERWDGNGYPDGLAGEQIPIGARIIFVCDAYHAMINDGPHRTAVPPAEAIRRLEGGRGSQFDPAVVDVFLEKVLSHQAGPVAQASSDRDLVAPEPD
jgi:HD-GYP domain-containing protein (c-di-GMP phosphodiesterase class II)